MQDFNIAILKERDWRSGIEQEKVKRRERERMRFTFPDQKHEM
jgi:hypothetical protein